VVDAGYYDNYGVNLAATWLHERRDWLRQCRVGHVVLLHIRDGSSQADRNRPAWPADTTTGFSRGIEELGSPVQGALAAREAVMAYRNEEQLEFLTSYFNRRQDGRPVFTTALIENPATVSMSWYMTRRETIRLLRAIREDFVQKPIKALTRLWLDPF
jgi:hypothetical protein